MIVFDLFNRQSFKNVDNWVRELKEVTDESLTILLVGNKADLEKREVSALEAMNYANGHGMKYIETSAKTGANVIEAFNEIAKEIYIKVANGVIDPKHDSSGVKIGSEIEKNQHSQAKNTKIEHQNKNKKNSCINC